MQITQNLHGEEVAICVKNLDLDLPVYLDMEDDEIKVEGKSALSHLVRVFNTEIEKTGKWAGVYANLDWFRNYLDEDIRKKYTTWIAHVENTDNQDKYKGQYDMFQYSWKGKIDGIKGNNGNVDMNILYRDLISEIKGKKPESIPKDYQVFLVTTESLNIRQEPNANSKILGQFHLGNSVAVFEIQGDWGRTDKGWINLNYTTYKNPIQIKMVIANKLNIRQEPNQNSKIIGQFSKGNRIVVFKEENGWSLTDKGWVNSNYIA